MVLKYASAVATNYGAQKSIVLLVWTYTSAVTVTYGIEKCIVL